jgi:tryptophanyl-tRNA synthetase
MSTQSPRPRVLSGIQPTSGLTLGNYIGAIKGWVQRQAEKDNLFCIVDLHALTMPQDPAALRKNTRELAAMYLACGLNPDNCILFVQSHVRAHTEASWLLNCITPLGWLNKMTQFKDKSAKQDSVGTGLLVYPVLMAADILLYQTDEVPVGEDQKQHVELARNIAERFNHLFGPTFKVPNPIIPQVGARIMGLDDPTLKMSKSHAHQPGHAIFLSDTDDAIMKAFKRATTDSGNEIKFSDAVEKAGVNNLLSVYLAITGKSKEACEADFATARGYGDLKVKVAEVVIAELKPIRERFAALMQDPAAIDTVLKRGAHAAAEIAEATLATMKEKIGLLAAI